MNTDAHVRGANRKRPERSPTLFPGSQPNSGHSGRRHTAGVGGPAPLARPRPRGLGGAPGAVLAEVQQEALHPHRQAHEVEHQRAGRPRVPPGVPLQRRLQQRLQRLEQRLRPVAQLVE